MRTLQQHLTHYAGFHRDRRNIVTHFIGIPMIVVSLTTLLARPVFEIGGVALSPAIVYAGFVALFWLVLDLRFGAATAAVLAVALVIGQWLGAQSTTLWLTAGIGLFVVGWAIQFIGHYYEGRKPAFADDVFGLVVGTGVVFLIAETAFAMRLRGELQRTIEASAGPTLIRDLSLKQG
jgi:uncharacterized membrane protein YGL010W